MKYIRAVFASEDTSDQFSRRSLVVASDRHILIGRAPNHATKKPKAAFDNFYLMSPIVSRRHATITMSEAGCLQITDNKSTHGTTINGIDLKPDTKHTLQTGDTLRFGIPIINGSTTHKPPEFKILFIGPATPQLVSTSKESASNKWQFVVPESESSCEGDDDLSSVVQINDPFTIPSEQLDDILSDTKNDTLMNMSSISDFSCCPSELANGQQHDESNEYGKDKLDLSDVLDGTDSLFNESHGKGKEDKIDDCNRSKSLTSLKNILNDSSNSPPQKKEGAAESVKASPHCDVGNDPNIPEILDAYKPRQFSGEISKNQDKEIPTTDSLGNKGMDSFEMSDILKISTSPPKEEGSNQSQRASLKRKASCISVGTAGTSDMELRKGHKRHAIVTVPTKFSSAKPLDQSTFASSTKLGKKTRLQFTSAFLGAVFGGVGVFATLASLPDNFFQ